jgi:hypothetical protein
VGRRGNIGRRFCDSPEIFSACQAAIAGKPAMNDDAVSGQNSNVLESVTCRESPMDTKNRLAAEV